MKNQAISLICSGDMLIKKSWNLIGWVDFGPYLWNQNFPWYGICAGTANNINLHYRANSVKINGKLIQYIQKTLFLAHFWGKNFFSGKSGFVVHNFMWVPNIMPKFRKKLMIQFQENTWTDGQTEGWPDPIL